MGFFSPLYKCQDVTQRQTVKSSFLPGLNLGFTQLSEITRPPVCSRVFHQRQRARGERKPQNTKLFIETNSEQEGKYLVCSAAMVGVVGAVHGSSGGEQPALCFRTEWCTPWGHCRRPNITDASTHTVSPSLFLSLSLLHMHAHIHTRVLSCTRMDTHKKP